MYTWKGVKTFQLGLMPEGDFDDYISENVGAIYEGMSVFYASDAIFPSLVGASSTDIETSGGARIALVRYDYTAAPNYNSAHWPIRSWFYSSDISYIKVFGFIDASTDIQIRIGVDAISDGDDLTASAFSYSTDLSKTQLFSNAIPGNIEFTAPTSDAFDGVIPGDLFVVSVDRVGGIGASAIFYLTHFAIG